MALFGKKKKLTLTPAQDNVSPPAGTAPAHTAEKARVQVLGSGCAKCNRLEAAVREALKSLDMGIGVEHVTDFAQIAAYGVMSTPALVVDGKVVSMGKVLTPQEVTNLLQQAGR